MLSLSLTSRPIPPLPYTTLFRSNVERLMTLSTSLVAACRSSASLSFFSRSVLELRGRPTRVLGFDLLERALRPKKKLKEALRSEEHTSELQSLRHLVCRLLLEKK